MSPVRHGGDDSDAKSPINEAIACVAHDTLTVKIDPLPALPQAQAQAQAPEAHGQPIATLADRRIIQRRARAQTAEAQAKIRQANGQGGAGPGVVCTHCGSGRGIIRNYKLSRRRMLWAHPECWEVVRRQVAP